MMNPIPYQTMVAAPPQQWNPFFPPNPCPSSHFWTPFNVQEQLKELNETLLLANAMQKELQMLAKAKEAKASESDGDDVNGLCNFSQFMEDNRIDLGSQELISVESANGLMTKLRSLIEPFRAVTDESTPWEEKSAVFRLSDKVNKSKRNKRWRKKKRKRIAEAQTKEREQFDKLDKEADEWRAREIAKDIAQRKVEKMKEIAKQKAKEEKKRLEDELELALMVEKLQELRSIRIQKLKKQGHFLPEEDDKFLEKVRAAVEEEERQAKAAADTDAAKDAIAAAEESRKATLAVNLDQKDEISNNDDKEKNQEQKPESVGVVSEAPIHEELEKPVSEGQGYGAYDYVASLPPEFYHYYHGSNTDMGTLIEVRRTWDAYVRPGGSRIPGHWVEAPPPSDEIWASYLAPP